MLILVHNQHVLKDQFAEDAPKGLDVFVLDGPEDVERSNEHKVVVATPASAETGHRKVWSGVIDEAHNF